MKLDKFICIALIPRWSEAIFTVQLLMKTQPFNWFVVAIAETDREAVAFRNSWTGNEAIPLLLLRTSQARSGRDAIDVVVEIAQHHPGASVSVLLCDGPDISGFHERRRKAWNCHLADAVAAVVLDIQVLEYDSSWIQNPPRPR